MPKVVYQGQRIDCARGALLKDVLARAGASPHKGPFKVLNCRGHGTCGSCAVEVLGPTSTPGFFERLRVMMPPLFHREGRLRLACKTHVEGDVEVIKHGGLWGQRVDG